MIYVQIMIWKCYGIKKYVNDKNPNVKVIECPRERKREREREAYRIGHFWEQKRDSIS